MYIDMNFDTYMLVNSFSWHTVGYSRKYRDSDEPIWDSQEKYIFVFEINLMSQRWTHNFISYLAVHVGAIEAVRSAGGGRRALP